MTQQNDRHTDRPTDRQTDLRTPFRSQQAGGESEAGSTSHPFKRCAVLCCAVLCCAVLC